MSLTYQFLDRPGAVSAPRHAPHGYENIAPRIIELVPEAVAREQLVVPLRLEGETVTLAAVNAYDLPLRDKLTFILNKRIVLVPGQRESVVAAINFYYGQTESESVDSLMEEFTDAGTTFGDHQSRSIPAAAANTVVAAGKMFKRSLVEFKKGMMSADEDRDAVAFRRHAQSAVSPGGAGMFFYTVSEGQRVLMCGSDGTMEILVGPRRVWRGWSTFVPMQQFIAHPGAFLIVRFRDGRQDHLAGPAEVWLDPRIHQTITCQDSLQLGSKEAVVVYARRGEKIERRIEYGPAQFIPQPGEWLHTFAWHASKGGHLGVEKVPHGLVFQKIWLMPDQMYHDVADVRTADDAVLTVRLMIFFELISIERMLDTTHDPIGDFVNAATSDVVAFTGRHDFESFKRNVTQLNELETYGQLASRAEQCGYRINKVVYRGYGAPKPLQDMHDKAIEARTKLQLDRATEQQAQDLENYKLEAQITRASRRRTEQTTELDHDLEMARRRQEAELVQKQSQRAMLRDQRRQENELSLTIRQHNDAQKLQHVTALRDLGVDLTAFLTQSRADRVIELRGPGAATHLHLDHEEIKNNGSK